MSNEPSKILIAHGNTRKLRAAVEILREAGFDVIATPDGGDAFARFFEEEPGTVLCSAQLPGLSGVSFAAMVRSQAPATHVAILVDPDAPAELAEAPGVSTILEPFSLESLHALFPALEGRTPSEVIDDQVPTTAGLFALAALKRFQRDNSLLAVVDDSGLHAIAGIAENEVLAGDARVISEGEPGDGFYLVVEGQVKVTLAEKGNQEIARIGAGGFFGEMAMLSARPRSASIWTVGPTTLLFFPKEAFVPLLEKYPTMREVLSGVALKRTEENLWRSLFDDEDVQRSLGNLGAIDLPAPPTPPIAPAVAAGEGSWGAVATSGGAPKASSAGGGTWNPLPGPIEDAVSAAEPPVVTRLPVQDFVDHGHDEEIAHVVQTARRKGFLAGVAMGVVLGVFLAAFAVMRGLIHPSARTESYETDKPTAVGSPLGSAAPTVLPPVPLGPPKSVAPVEVKSAQADTKAAVETKAPEPKAAAPVETKTPEPKAAAPVETKAPAPVDPKAAAPVAPKAATSELKTAAPVEPKVAPPAAASETKAAPPAVPAPPKPAPAAATAAPAPAAVTATPAPTDPAAVPAELANSTIADADRKKLRRELMAGIREGGDAVKAVKAGLALEAGNALDWESVFALARAQQLGGEADKALTRYTDFVTKYPKNDFVDDAYYYTGEILEARGRKADALAAFKKVLARPNSNLLEQAQAHADALQ